MQKIDTIHYIWIGNTPRPTTYTENLELNQKLNPTIDIQTWTDDTILPLLTTKRKIIFQNSSLFHKLQLAKYTVLNTFGGLYTDYDITWHYPANQTTRHFKPTTKLITIQRNSLHFYHQHKKTPLLDDYVLISKPDQTEHYLNYCEQRTTYKNHESEPYSVYALTEWIKETQYTDIEHFYPYEIGSTTTATYAIHSNQMTWLNKLK